MLQFQPFEMERFMSAYEQAVDYNLSESGVHPMQLRELLGFDDSCLGNLLETEINYAHANGTPELRKNIARLYKGATPENVLVTVGAIEANFNTMHSILNRGDEIVVMLPNYMQIWGVAKNYGFLVKTFSLQEEKGWAPDLDTLEKTVSGKTKMIAICNPNNPTGYILKEEEMNAIIRIADKAGAWILADEVYTGAEQFTDAETPSFYGKYEKVLAVNSMSKAYGLPGLRTGWVVGPEKMMNQIWARHEYTTLSAALLSNKLAALALSERVRSYIIQRTRDYIRKGFSVLEEWIGKQGGVLSCIPPQAAAIAFIKYNLDFSSINLVEKILRKKSVLIIPGDHFGMGKFIRVSFGLQRDYLIRGLERIGEVITELRQ